MIINKNTKMLIRAQADKPIGFLIDKATYLRDYYDHYEPWESNNGKRGISRRLRTIGQIYYEGEELKFSLVESDFGEDYENIVFKNETIKKALLDIKRGWALFDPLYLYSEELRAAYKQMKTDIDLVEKIKEQDKEIARLKKLKEPTRKHTKIALHYLNQNFGDNRELSLFSDKIVDAFENNTNLQVIDRPKSFGVVLNQAQQRVLEGLLTAFSDTNYKGDVEIDSNDYNNQIYPINDIGKAYENINKIPLLKITQAEIVRLSGYSRTQNDLTEVVQALSFLSTKQFCFYWVRSKTDYKGNIEKNKKGDYIKEEVDEVGTILRIKAIRNEKQELQYYEIAPSAPLLDQIGDYFLLVPNNWREEVKALTGKRGSNYTYEFLLWLRRKFEQIRRYNKNKNRIKKPFTIATNWEEVAIALKMPESMYKRNRPRSLRIIQECYSVAVKLGYLIKVEDNGAGDTLYLNEKYYPKPGELK